MPLYHYQAFSKEGKLFQGTLDAYNEEQVKKRLILQGLVPTKIKNTEESFFAQVGTFFEQQPTEADIALFTKQLSVLLKANIPLLRAIELVTEQFTGGFFKILNAVRNSVKEGLPLSKALDQYGTYFPVIYRKLLFAGEQSGRLDEILMRLSIYLKKELETKERLYSALRGPMFNLVLVGCVLIGIIGFFVPSMTSMLTQSGSKLPAPTKLLMDISEFVTTQWKSLMIGCISSFCAIRFGGKTKTGRILIDSLLLKIPVVSSIIKTRSLVEFSQTLGLLLENEVDLSQALSIAALTVSNTVIQSKLFLAREEITREGKIAKNLKLAGVFPNVATYMIQTGEESGMLGKILLTIGNDYEKELEEKTEVLLDMITPFMTIIVGAVILLTMLAVFLPALEMASSVDF